MYYPESIQFQNTLAIAKNRGGSFGIMHKNKSHPTVASIDIIETMVDVYHCKQT